MSRKRRFIGIFSALVHAFFVAYGFWSLNQVGTLAFDILIGLGAIILGSVTYVGMADHWDVLWKEKEKSVNLKNNETCEKEVILQVTPE